MKNDRFRWSYLAHLGYNMWADPVVDKWGVPGIPQELTEVCAQDTLRFDRDMFREEMKKLADAGCDTLILDLGEGVRYESHPEISSKTAFSKEELQTEIRLLKDWGIEVIPKLNFSNTHNGWLKGLRRQVSTPAYYAACSDVIRDVVEIFDRPRMLHLGYDEETAGHQAALDFVAVRKGELWWHDFLWFVGVTEKLGVRPWVWSDYGWHHPEYVKRCPKSVMQSNWYYDEDLGGFSLDKARNRYWDILQLYLDLEKAGFDQIPCGSNWLSPKHKANGRTVNDSMPPLMDFCRGQIAPERLKGFMMASWASCKSGAQEDFIRAGIDLVANRM